MENNFLEDTSIDQRQESEMTVVEHLDEFRTRFLRCLVIVCLSTLGLFWYSADFLDTFLAFTNASSSNPLHVFGPSEAFVLRLKLSFLCALALTLPWIIFEICRYVFPAISKEFRIPISFIIICGLIMFYSGTALAFFFLIPHIMTMLASFTPASIQSTINASEYLDLIVKFCLTFGLIAELPVISALLSLAGILKPSTMIKFRKYIIVGIWIFAAVITPPDVLSQALVAIPLMLLYELSIILCWIISKIKRL